MRWIPSEMWGREWIIYVVITCFAIDLNYISNKKQKQWIPPRFQSFGGAAWLNNILSRDTRCDLLFSHIRPSAYLRRFNVTHNSLKGLKGIKVCRFMWRSNLLPQVLYRMSKIAFLNVSQTLKYTTAIWFVCVKVTIICIIHKREVKWKCVLSHYSGSSQIILFIIWYPRICSNKYM